MYPAGVPGFGALAEPYVRADSSLAHPPTPGKLPPGGGKELGRCALLAIPTLGAGNANVRGGV